MNDIVTMLSTMNTILVIFLVFKDMSGKEELRKIRQQLERMNEIFLKVGR